MLLKVAFEYQWEKVVRFRAAVPDLKSFQVFSILENVGVWRKYR